MVTHPFQPDNARISTFASVISVSPASTWTQMPGASARLERRSPVILRRNDHRFRAHKLGNKLGQLVHIVLREAMRGEDRPPARVVQKQARSRRRVIQA